MTKKKIYAAPFREGDVRDLEKARKEEVFFCKVCDSFERGVKVPNGRNAVIKCARCGSIQTDRAGNIVKYPISVHS